MLTVGLSWLLTDPTHCGWHPLLGRRSWAVWGCRGAADCKLGGSLFLCSWLDVTWLEFLPWCPLSDSLSVSQINPLFRRLPWSGILSQEHNDLGHVFAMFYVRPHDECFTLMMSFYLYETSVEMDVRPVLHMRKERRSDCILAKCKNTPTYKHTHTYACMCIYTCKHTHA